MSAEISAERLRIARELHDGIAQEIAATGYRIDEVIGRENVPLEVRSDLRSIRAQISEVSESIRDQIFLLRGLPARSFPEAVASLVETHTQNQEVECTLEIDEYDPGSFRFELLKIIQECVINSLRHSHATALTISFQQGVLNLSDNGVGFQESTEVRFGLLGLQERVAGIGASLEIHTSSEGTRIVVRLATARNTSR
ncbi:MAG: histidine kinase [Actinomycetes bacterium]